jgi:hypothetical protein
MPDIAMCYHETCPAREHCKRHPDSGTKPNPHWQSVVMWQPTLKDADDYESALISGLDWIIEQEADNGK